MDGRNKLVKIDPAGQHALLALTLLLQLLLLTLACSKSQHSAAGGATSKEAALTEVAEKLVDQKDENGLPTKIEGYVENTSLQEIKEGDQIDTGKLNDPAQMNQKLFEFEAPSGYESDFSEPVMIHGAFLVGDPIADVCAKQTYFPKEPTLADMLAYSRRNELCGDLLVNFCIRLRKSGERDEAAYLRSPPVSVRLVCPEEAFAGVSAVINGGAETSASASVDLTLGAGPLVSEMYITNSAACNSEGIWQPFVTEKKGWRLAEQDGPASVYISFRDIIGHESSCYSATINLQGVARDTSPPLANSLSINNGATYATDNNVTLQLSADDASEMYATNSANCEGGGEWLPYASAKAWTLAQINATTSVYVKFRDQAGNESACLSDSIIHDNIPPSSASLLVNNAASTTTSSSVSLTLAATDATEMFITNTSGCLSGGVWRLFNSTLSAWSLAQTNASNQVYAIFRDEAGNTSACVSGSIVHDDQVPSPASLAINGGASHTSLPNATLNLTAAGAAQMYVTNTAGCGSGGSWENFAVTKSSWPLAQTNAMATVYVRYRDSAGNTSACLSDTIIHDSIAPTGEGLTIESGATYTSSFDVSLSLSASNADEMYITNTAGCASGGSWESFAGAKASWNLGQSNTTTNVYVMYRDQAQNNSSCATASITHDDQGPSGASLQINTNATYTTDDDVTLALAATGAQQMYITNTAGCGANGTWETYATSKAWVVSSNTTSSVYVKFRDAALNESSCVADSIVHDDTPPATPASMSDGGSTSVISSSPLLVWSASSDAGSGLARYEVAIGTTAGAVDILAWTDVGVVTAKVMSGLSLALSTTYYVNVRAVDQAGLNSSVTTGDGFTYRPWQQEAYIKAVNNTAAATGDFFGSAVAVYGDTLAVGAYGEDSPNTTITNGNTAETANGVGNSGAAYVYLRSGTTWVQQAYIKAFNNGVNDNFGDKVALHADTLVVGAYAEDSTQTTITNGTTAATDNSASGNSGAAYVYKRTGTTWAQEAFIKAVNRDDNDRFGASVAIDGDSIAVGAYFEGSGQTTITNGTTASTDNSNGVGAVYVYKRTGTTWAQEAYVKGGNTNYAGLFGDNVALNGDTLAVGASLDSSAQNTITNGTLAPNDNLANESGAAYVYQRTGTEWAQQAYIKPVNNSSGYWFGYSVAVDGNTLVVGAPQEGSAQSTITNGTTAATDYSDDSSWSGAAYVYQRTGTTWAQQAFIKASNTWGGLTYAERVVLSGDTLVAGSIYDGSDEATVTNGTTADVNTPLSRAGAAYVYQRTATIWQQEAYLKASNPNNYDAFSVGIAMHADTIAIGADGESSNVTTITNGTTSSTDNSNPDAGAVYIFRR